MFEQLTERARQVVVLAQEEARTLKHNYIGTEHILLGLLREEEGLAARVLESLDISVERVRAQVVRIVGSGEEVTSGQIPFTPRAKKVLELALREALSLGHNYIGTEHILLGLVRENEGVAARILLDFDAAPQKIRDEVIRMLSGPGGRRQGRGTSSPPADSSDLEGQIQTARREKEAAIEAQEFEKAARLREKERKLTNRKRAMTAPASVPPVVPHAWFHGQRDRPVLDWDRAKVLWRPEGLELRVPLNLGEGALASFAADEVWSEEPLASIRREIWSGWLALASPTLLEDIDPAVLRRVLDAAAKRAGDVRGREQGRVEDFLRRLRDDPAAED